MRSLKNILVTGGAGFIGCNFIRTLLLKTPSFTGRVINLDKLTYAGNPESLADIDASFAGNRYFFERGDITDREFVGRVFDRYAVDTVVHFAAESHVDRSILGPEAFVKTNVLGTFTLLEAARERWLGEGGAGKDGGGQERLFHHISTDEVYGSLGDTGYFYETTAYDPRSPYSASKAASDHLAMSYFHTYGLPVTLSNCSNNYGPFQFPEKLIPLSILNILDGKPLPVYGDGKNIRDWVYVEDHNRAVWDILCRGRTGEKYNIGGNSEKENIALLRLLIEKVCAKAGLDKGKVESAITFVKDRPGHDRRYAINCNKIEAELGWRRQVTLDEGLDTTVEWYLKRGDWTARVRSGEYRNWIEANYARR